MKCPYCNQEHSDDAVFCPQTGKRIQEDKLACTENPDCPIHGQRILPLNAIYCPECGAALKKSSHSRRANNEEPHEKWDTKIDFSACLDELNEFFKLSE